MSDGRSLSVAAQGSEREAALARGQGGELPVSGSGSVVLPAGLIDPSLPMRNIRMKFAVLTGLIRVGEVSNRDIVETVLNLLGSLCQ
ncbi:neurobeachin-like isoform X2 [Arapaima gigas]